LLDALANISLEVILIDTMHPLLKVPAFYTIVPGAHFRERASGTSVAMFSAKLITEKLAPDQAIGELEKIDALLPGKYYIQFYLGTCHLALSHLDTALSRFRAASEMNPTNQDAASIHVYQGICLKEMGRYHDALATLEAGETYDTERTDLYNLMGFCHFKLRNHEKAIKCFERVIQLDPSSAIDYANIASNYRDLGDTKRAITYYETALAIDDTIDFARDNLSKLKSS
jgi:ribosomal protein S12 methylthiotransferase accessory factor